MDTAPIQPVKLWIRELHIVPNPAYDPGSPYTVIPQADMDARLEEGMHDSSSMIYRCLLDITTHAATAEGQAAYSVVAKAVGLFALLRNVEMEWPQLIDSVASNGLSIVYSFARGVILQVTSQGEHGGFLLPAVSLQGVAVEITTQASASRIAQIQEQLARAGAQPLSGTSRKE